MNRNDLIELMDNNRSLIEDDVYDAITSIDNEKVAYTTLIDELTGKVIITEEVLPVLVLGKSDFLSWFRGYRFQVSGTYDGIINRGSSPSSLGKCISIAGNNKKISTDFLVVAHVLIAMTQRYEDTSWINKYSASISELLKLTDEYYDLKLTSFDFMHIIDTAISNKEITGTSYECVYNKISRFKLIISDSELAIVVANKFYTLSLDIEISESFYPIILQIAVMGLCAYISHDMLESSMHGNYGNLTLRSLSNSEKNKRFSCNIKQMDM